MSLDILLLGGTIVVAVGAVIVGLLRAVLERRRAPSLWAQYRSRRIEPERLARAVPGPTAADGSIRALELQAPAIGSRSSYAALGVPVVAEPVPVMAEPVVVLPEPVPLVPEAIEPASEVPDAAPEAAAPEPAVAEPELVEVVAEPEPVIAAPELVEVAPEPMMAEPEPMATAPRSRPTAPEFAWVTPAVAAATPEPVTEDIVGTLPAAKVETEVGPGADAEPVPDIAAAAVPPEAEPEAEPAAAPGPVPLFLPGTYPVAEADLAPENGNLVPMPAAAPAAKATAAMVAGYAPVARAIVRPPEPDGIEDELAYRIGIPGAKRPERPSVIEVAGGQEVAVPVIPTVETEVWPVRRSRRRRRAAIGLAALVGATSLALAVAVIVPNLSQPAGDVQSATGTPHATNDAGLVPPETSSPAPAATPTVVPASAAPVASPSPAPTASPSPSPSAAASEQVKTASVTPRPQATPRAVAPTPKPTPKPTAKPTPKPSPTPIAFFQCVADVLILHCDGSGSDHAVTYLWYFGEGPTQTGAQASHEFASPGRYLVTLTVTNPSGSNTDSNSYVIP